MRLALSRLMLDLLHTWYRSHKVSGGGRQSAASGRRLRQWLHSSWQLRS